MTRALDEETRTRVRGEGRGRWCARVAVGDETLARALGRHLERVGCSPVACESSGVVAVLTSAESAREALVELSLYLAMWPAPIPDVRAVTVSRSTDALRGADGPVASEREGADFS